MTLKGVKYHEVQESFAMGGPYIGKLEFRSVFLESEYLADGEKLSEDRSKIVFSKYLGFSKKGIFRKVKRDFRILVYEELTDAFFQSRNSFEALAIERMINNQITFHVAFHTKIKRFERVIEFNERNFERITSNMDDFDVKFTETIVNILVKKLERDLTSDEKAYFTMPRSGIAYEMIMDFISDEQLGKNSLESYVKKVVAETKM